MKTENVGSGGSGTEKSVRPPIPRIDLRWLRTQFSCDLEVPDLKLTPRGDQLVGAVAVICTPWLMLTDDVGLGKSIVTLMAIRWLVASGRISRVLLLCPGKVLYQWQAEVEKWFGDALTTHVVDGTPDQRRSQYKRLRETDGHPIDHTHIVMVSYGLARNDLKLLQTLRFDMLVTDEASAYRNAKTELAKALRTLAPKIPRRLGITATPVQNHLQEYHSILSVISPWTLGPWGSFSRDHCTVVEMPIRRRNKDGDLITLNIEKVVGYRNLDRLKDQLSTVMFGRTVGEIKASGVSFPDLIVGEPGLDRWLDMTTDQSKRYDELEQGILSSGGRMSLMETLVKLTRLQQASVDPRLVDPTDGPGCKIKELEDLLTGELSGRQVVVFSKYLQFHHIAVVPLLNDLGLSYVEINGEVSDFDAEQRRQAFQSGDKQIAVITTSGEMGLNLDAAATMVCCDVLINEARMRQIYGRICRSSSEHSVATVYQLLTKNSIEERVLQIRAQRGAVLDWLDDPTQYTADRMSTLLRLINRQISLADV